MTGSKLFRDIGNVTEETKFSFEYSTRPPSEVPAGLLEGLTELPFQVQIRYTRLNGMQCVRVISRSQVCADRLYPAVQCFPCSSTGCSFRLYRYASDSGAIRPIRRSACFHL